MMPPHEIGCLLLHGFTSSPQEMAGLAALLAAKGFTVRAPRLPGHATHPRDLLHVSHHDWLVAAEQGLQDIRRITRQQVAIGLSLGATLALHLAANFDLAGVVALAPALKLSWWATATVHLLSPFNYIRRKAAGPDVKDRAGKALLRSYQSYPIAAAKPALRLMRLVRAELARITAPLLAVHAVEDHTIPVSNLEYLLQRVQSTQVDKLIVTNSYHVLTVDHDREEIFARVLAFINSVTVPAAEGATAR